MSYSSVPEAGQDSLATLFLPGQMNFFYPSGTMTRITVPKASASTFTHWMEIPALVFGDGLPEVDAEPGQLPSLLDHERLERFGYHVQRASDRVGIDLKVPSWAAG